MNYLDWGHLQSISAEAFQKREPFPWVQIEKPLTAEGYERLLRTLPAIEGFDKHVDAKRAYGQAPHNRYMLHYRAGLELAVPWQVFLAELNGQKYGAFLQRLLGHRTYILTFSWHYAWEGCSVSPHCDAARKRATHLFYFNDEKNWDQTWGGATLILGCDRRIPTHSAPDFDQFRVAAACGPTGNGSLLFARTPHSWHGMRQLRCPAGRLRQIFSVTVNILTAQVLWRQLRGKDPDGFRLRAA
jgi:hypothetical protein